MNEKKQQLLSIIGRIKKWLVIVAVLSFAIGIFQDNLAGQFTGMVFIICAVIAVFIEAKYLKKTADNKVPPSYFSN